MLIVSLFYIWHFKRIMLGFGILSIAIIGLSVAPDAIRDRLMTGLGGGSSVSDNCKILLEDDQLTAGRVYIWSQRMSDIQRSPIWGNGLESGQWSDVVKSGKNHLDNAHNLYLTILTDLGIIGLILMVLFYRYLWRLVSSLSKDERVSPVMRGYFLAILSTLFALPITGISGWRLLGLHLPLVPLGWHRCRDRLSADISRSREYAGERKQDSRSLV